MDISTECELHCSGFQSGVWTSVRIEELGSECGRQQEVWQLSKNWTSVQMCTLVLKVDFENQHGEIT